MGVGKLARKLILFLQDFIIKLRLAITKIYQQYIYAVNKKSINEDYEKQTK